MRSRFLNVDYFCRSLGDIADDFESLLLPIPDLFPSDPVPDGKFGTFDADLKIPMDLQDLFFENALSRFISAVIPQNYGDRHETLAHREEKNETIGASDHSRIFQGILFEIPETGLATAQELIMENPVNDCLFMASLQISDSSLHKQLGIFENISGAESLYLKDLVQPHDFVNSMKPEYRVECSLEAAGYAQNEEPCISIIPFFESCDSGLFLHSSNTVEETFHAIVTDISIKPLFEYNSLDFKSCDLLSDCTVNNFRGCGLYKRIMDAELHVPGLTLLKEIELNMCLVLKMLDHCYLPSEQIVSFDEVQLLHFSFIETILSYDNYVIPTDHDFLEPSLAESTSSRSFYEVLVSPELVLTDDMFKSLLVPAIDDDKETVSLSAIIKGVFCDLQMYSSSASDQIYLDWHLSQEDECTRSICCIFKSRLDIVTSCEIPSRFAHPKDDMIINGILFDDRLTESSTIYHSQEKCEATQKQMFKTEDTEMLPYGENALKDKSEKVSLLIESMSLSSDLNFFLNARKGTATRSCEDELQNRAAEETTAVVAPSMYLNKSFSSPGVISHTWNVEVHFIIPSDVILNIIDAIYKSYMSMIQDEKESISNCKTGDDDIPRFSKKNLMDQIKSLTEERLPFESERVMHLSALYAMKQMAHHVCFSGIHACYFYMNSLFHKHGYLGARLHSLKSTVEDAYCKAEKDAMEFHPALTVMEKILQTCTQSGKILIVADRSIWWPLTRKLTAIGVSFQELESKNSCFDYNMPEQHHKLNKFAPVATLQSDCLIISNEYLSSSFPFHLFSNVLEYGGCYGSSKVSSICQEVNGMPHVQFLKLKLEDRHVPGALSDGFNIFQHLELSPVENYQPSSYLQELGNWELVNLLNWVPLFEDYKLVYVEPDDKVGAGFMLEENSHVLHSKDSEHMDLTSPSFPSLIVIANTQRFSHELLTSRRSSYQQILAMEKDGIQVVEREMHLPVDLILSASTCLVWFDAKRFLQTSIPEVPPSVPLCVESISTSLLLSISFSFSHCILIFEGETRFLSSVMEVSDGLYAAGASLDIHLQLFFSGCSDLTDKIVLNCIGYASKSNERIFPVMLESETLGESFLTSFPSMNPLSAHAILSCGTRVSDFFQMPLEQRLQTIQKYHVPDESLNLFSVLCRFGEIAESKSDMTECSSTVASALDSDSSYKRTRTLPKKRKYETDDHLFDIPSNEYLNFMPENIFGSVVQPPTKLPSQPTESCSCSEDPFHFRINETQDPELQLEGPSGMKQQDSGEFYGPVNYNDIKVDFDDLKFPIFNQNFLSSPENGVLSWESQGTGKRSSCGIGGYSFRLSPSRQPVLVSPDNDIESHNWTSLLSSKCSLDKKMNDQNPNVKIDGFQKKFQDNILQESIMKHKYRSVKNMSFQKATNVSAQNMTFQNATNLSASNMSLQEAINLRKYNDSPYCRASDSQQGSPSTFEFLKRIKDKSRMSNKFPHHISKNHLGKSPNSQISLKRQSPSILDSYRYQGSNSKPKSTSNHKWSRIFKSPLDSLKEQKTTCRLAPSWTPLDKRARQTLSFTRSGNEKQSKLTWSDQGALNVRKRCREET